MTCPTGSRWIVQLVHGHSQFDYRARWYNGAMERRTFLLGATGLAAMGARAANDRIGIGVIGLGGRGRDHLGYYSKLPDARVVAICDVNQAQTERATKMVEKLGGGKPQVHQDLRKLLEDKNVDAVSIATPNHWHALATIWACQAGKHVYCEKPASYNMFEGRAMVAAARKSNRIVQIGMQGRTIVHKQRAMDLLHSGAIGQVYMARGICFKRRVSIGHTPEEPPPSGLNWDLFLGPAPMREYTKNRYLYNWHWFWDTGNGDIGNQGIHEMDLARRGLGRELPKGAVSTGGKYVYEDDQETPNTQIATFDYGDAELVFEVRGLNTGGEPGIPASGPNFHRRDLLRQQGLHGRGRARISDLPGRQKRAGRIHEALRIGDRRRHPAHGEFSESREERQARRFECGRGGRGDLGRPGAHGQHQLSGGA